MLSAPCDQDTYMVQNLYSERELSIKLLLGEKNSKTKLTYDHFRPTHTYIKLTFVSYFLKKFCAPFPSLPRKLLDLLNCLEGEVLDI